MQSKTSLSAKQFATDSLQTTSKMTIQKTVEASGDLISNKIAVKSKKISKTLTTK